MNTAYYVYILSIRHNDQFIFLGLEKMLVAFIIKDGTFIHN